MAWASRETATPLEASDDVAAPPLRLGAFSGRTEGTPGIVRSNSGTGGGAGTPSVGCSDNNSSREGKWAQTMVQIKANPTVDAANAVNFPGGSAWVAGFILTRIDQHDAKITETHVSRNNPPVRDTIDGERTTDKTLRHRCRFNSPAFLRYDSQT